MGGAGETPPGVAPDILVPAITFDRMTSRKYATVFMPLIATLWAST